MRPLTLGYLTFADLPPADLVSAARAGGFDGVSLRIAGRFKTDPFFDVVGNAGAVKEIGRRLSGEGVRLSSVSGYYVSPSTTTSDFQAIVDIAAELGAPYIVANRHEPDDARYVPLMQFYCDAAAAVGIRVAVEFMRYSACPTLASALTAIERVGRANFGVLCDPLHLARSGGTPADIARAPRDRIYLAQLCDGRGPAPQTIEGLMTEARTGRLPPGEGDLPLYDYLSALPQDFEIEIEVPRPSDGSTAAERARVLGEQCRAYLARYDAQRPAGAAQAR